MRFTRGAVCKEGQWEQMAELQIDTAALQRWILREENNHETCQGDIRSNNSRLLERIDEQWEVDRTDNANTEKKHLLEYEEWAATDMGHRSRK